jgi:protein-L-isoaspartate(D-aspartate) O-methyltransferase
MNSSSDYDHDLNALSKKRKQLVQRLAASGIKNQQVLTTLQQVPRHKFVDEALANRAYEETALPIGYGQTISHPYTVARMTEAILQSNTCSKVLEIGTGSGFQTAVLAHLVPYVYSIERIAALWVLANQRLRALQLYNVHLRYADGHHGWAQQAPFDGILITAAPLGIPRRLAEQLVYGGRMVAPLQIGSKQFLVSLTRTKTDFKYEMLGPASFVPLLGGIA